jgi:hypothetical protein
MRKYAVYVIDTIGTNDETVATFNTRLEAVSFAQKFRRGQIKTISEDYINHMVAVYNEVTDTEIFCKGFNKNQFTF